MTSNKMAFVFDEVTPEMIALDELLATDDLTDVCPIGFDEEEWVEITREITVDPAKYRSPNYQPAPGSIPQSEPDPDDDTSDDLPPEPYGQDEAIALDATLPCNTTFANCQAKNPLLCPYHGAKLIEADIKAGLAQTIPNAVVSVKANKAGQAKGKNFSISIKVPASQKLAAEKALDDFLQQPGIKSQGMKDWDPRSNEWSDFYDVDLLQLNSAPQGGMANRAALANSVGQSLNPQQASQQQTTQTTPASQQAAATTPPQQTVRQQQQSPNQTGTPAKSGHVFKTTYPTGPMTQPVQTKGGWTMSQGGLNALNKALGSAYNPSGLQWNNTFDKLNIACPNPTMQQGQAIADNLGNGYVVKVKGKSGFTIYPANQATQPQQASQPQQPTQQVPASTNGQQPVQGGYQPLSDVDDDRKFLTSMKGKAAANELQDLEDLIDEKEQLIDQIDATRLAMSNGDPKDAQMYQSIIDYASGGLKDVDEKVLEAKESLSNKYDSKECQPAGATCAQIKANLEAQGATFIPKALDNMEATMAAKMTACQNKLIKAGLTEAKNPADWKKICDLVEQSFTAYLSKAAMRARIPATSVDKYLFGPSHSYFNNYSANIMTSNYGIASPKLKDFRLCCSATDADRSGFAPGQSDWGDDCAITIRKDNTFCAFIDYNTGGSTNAGENMTPISKPGVLSIGEYYKSNYIPWIRQMLQTGKPDLMYSRQKEESMLGNGHNECHAFCGTDSKSTSENILDHIQEIEFKSKSAAQACVQKHSKDLKAKKIKVTYYNSSTQKADEYPNP